MKSMNVGNVCACCGSYYVVTPEEAKKLEASEDMYEALTRVMTAYGGQIERESSKLHTIIMNTLAETEGK